MVSKALCVTQTLMSACQVPANTVDHVSIDSDHTNATVSPATQVFLSWTIEYIELLLTIDMFDRSLS